MPHPSRSLRRVGGTAIFFRGYTVRNAFSESILILGLERFKKEAFGSAQNGLRLAPQSLRSSPQTLRLAPQGVRSAQVGTLSQEKLQCFQRLRSIERP